MDHNNPQQRNSPQGAQSVKSIITWKLLYFYYYYLSQRSYRNLNLAAHLPPHRCLAVNSFPQLTRAAERLPLRCNPDSHLGNCLRIRRNEVGLAIIDSLQNLDPAAAIPATFGILAHSFDRGVQHWIRRVQ